MKNVFLLFAIIVTLFGCKKENPTPAPTTPISTVTPAGIYYIEAKIDGNLVKADKTISVQSDSAYNSFDSWTTSLSMAKYVSITTGENWSINMSYDLDSIVIPSTYNGNMGNMTITYFPPSATMAYWNDQYDPTTTLTFTSKTNDILEGSFTGKLYSTGTPKDSIAVTNGKFKVKVYRL